MKHLGLIAIASPQFNVIIGNNNKLEFQGWCLSVPLIIQRLQFSELFYVLPIQGAELVVRVQWLQTLGPIRIDYGNLTMQFVYQGALVVLQGENGEQLIQISHNQFKRLVRINGVASCFKLKA